MNRDLKLSDTFGGFCAEAERAAVYRFREIEPYLQMFEFIVLDFEGVRNVNASFANALLIPLFERFPEDARAKLRFKNCNALVRVVLSSALTLGLSRNGGVGVSA